MKLYKVMQKAEQLLKRRSNPNSKVIETFVWNGGSVDIVERLGAGHAATAYLGSDGMVYSTVKSDVEDQSKTFLALYLKHLRETNQELPKHLPDIEFLGRSHFNHHEWDLFRMPVYKMPLHEQNGWEEDAFVIEQIWYNRIYAPHDFDEKLLESYRGRFEEQQNFDQFFAAMRELMEFYHWAEHRGVLEASFDIHVENNGLDNIGRLIFVDPMVLKGKYKAF